MNGNGGDPRVSCFPSLNHLICMFGGSLLNITPQLMHTLTLNLMNCFKDYKRYIHI